MPTTSNKEYQAFRQVPDDISPHAEVFYHPSTNEIFVDYDDYFERMIQLNSSCWNCTITGKSGLTFEEALQSEAEAMEQINNFPACLQSPILFIVHRFTCRARVDELVSDVMTFMRDRYFKGEDVIYKQTSSKRLPARIADVHYKPLHELQNVSKASDEKAGNDDSLSKKLPQQNGGSPTKRLSSVSASPLKSSSKTPLKKEYTQPPDLEICRPECFSYSLEIIDEEPADESDSDASSSANSDAEDKRQNELSRCSKQLVNITHHQIMRNKIASPTRTRIKLFIRYYSELNDEGRMALKSDAIADFRLNLLSLEQIFADCPAPKFPLTRSTKKKSDRLSSISSANTLNNDTRCPATMQRLMEENLMDPSTSSSKQQPLQNSSSMPNVQNKRASTGVRKAEIRRKQIIDQQTQMEPLFKIAESLGVENLERWRQSFQFLSEEEIQELRNKITESKAAEKAALRRQRIEQRKREREALLEWKKPRDDLLCDDLQPFPDGYKELRWPDWVPSELYWDILSVQSFLQTFAEVLFLDGRNPFSLVNIATAIVSRQTSENTHFFQILDWFLTAINKSLEEDEGDPADLSKPEHVGNEAAKDLDHPVHGENIRNINKECERQKRVHGVHVRAFNIDNLNITEVIRIHLITSGFYTQYRRQLRGLMRCYEDDGYIFSRSETHIMELLKKSSVFALNPQERIKLFKMFIDQLLSHQRCRNLIDKRMEEMSELRRKFKHLKTVDQQHERESREALQILSQQNRSVPATDPENNALKSVPKQLVNLRRALIQMNEGRRVQNISEIKERILDEKNPLPWAQMESVNEVYEFRAVQRNFHADRVRELLHKIYELHGTMGLYFLGKDRAFRSYFYMCSTFVILCPPAEEFGPCGEPTPTVAALSSSQFRPVNEEEEETEADDDDIQFLDPQGIVEKKERMSGAMKLFEDNGVGSETKDDKVAENSSNGLEHHQHQKEAENEWDEFTAPIDPMMACVGKNSTVLCPVHNPTSGRLLYFFERDAVKKLLNALNSRGFRELELFENISLFKDIYTKEIHEALDLFEESRRSSSLPPSARLFGFSCSLPKELSGGSASDENLSIADALFNDVRVHLLDLEELMHERHLGALRCSASRDKWRKEFETAGHTAHLCVDNCVPVLYSSSPNEFLYTENELSGGGSVDSLTPEKKLGIALIQLVQGIRLECLQAPFMSETKKNGKVIKRVPSQTFIEWQRALKKCRSLSAVALFGTTFEYSVNWDFNSLAQGREKNGGGAVKSKAALKKSEPSSSAQTSSESHRRLPSHPLRPFREAESLLANAAGLLVSGPRQRKPVIKYGECEMDLDKLDFGEEDGKEEEDDEGGGGEEMGEEEMDDGDDRDDDEDNDESDGDEEEEEEMMEGIVRKISSDEEEEENGDENAEKVDKSDEEREEEDEDDGEYSDF